MLLIRMHSAANLKYCSYKNLKMPIKKSCDRSICSFSLVRKTPGTNFKKMHLQAREKITYESRNCIQTEDAIFFVLCTVPTHYYNIKSICLCSVKKYNFYFLKTICRHPFKLQRHRLDCFRRLITFRVYDFLGSARAI